jgi:hypothetical protein
VWKGYSYIGVHEQVGVPRYLKCEDGLLRQTQIALSVIVNAKLLHAKIGVFRVSNFEKRFAGISCENHIVVSLGNYI